MLSKKLSAGDIISNGAQIGISNFVPLLINFVLFIVTCWIPYLNIGTFIAIQSGITLKLSKGESVSPTEIFNSDYRKYFGEYFLLMGLMMIGIYFAMALMIVPALILSIAWMIADLLFLDGKAGIIDSLKKSNELTYNNKMSIFLSSIGLVVAIALILGLTLLIFKGGFIFGLVYFIVVATIAPISMGMKAYIYKELTADGENPELEEGTIE